MPKEKVLKANKKGELEISGVKPLDKYYLITGNDFLLLKKLNKPSFEDRFDKLIKETQKEFKKKKITKKDVATAIQDVRSER